MIWASNQKLAIVLIGILTICICVMIGVWVDLAIKIIKYIKRQKICEHSPECVCSKNFCVKCDEYKRKGK